MEIFYNTKVFKSENEANQKQWHDFSHQTYFYPRILSNAYYDILRALTDL